MEGSIGMRMLASSHPCASTNDISVRFAPKKLTCLRLRSTTATLPASVLVGSRCASVSGAKPRLLCSNDLRAYLLITCGCVCAPTMADFDTENGNNDKASNVWNLIFRQIHFDIPNIGFAYGAEFPYLLSVTEILL